MKIKRIELQGFKSFKDRTIIEFDQNITAIVGSNGCGKSNVVDALFWVMGDMSAKHLRGSSMKDVIFSGTKNYPSHDLAEVNLVLESEPNDPELPAQFKISNEIQITRRYYRSGESEYFINKVPCRLRDIQEFFMDTGIGAKGYSIIEQGAISKMVSQKPEDRRVVIEEVAGILKYKARRAETLRKIEATRVNLNRVDDIVKDVQKQLSTLKRQADKAEKFQTLSTELKDLDVRFSVRSWQDIKDNKVSNESLIVELEESRKQLEINKSSLADQLQELEAGFLEQELKVKQARDGLKKKELEFIEKEGRLNNFNSQKESVNIRMKSSGVKLAELNTKIQNIDGTITEKNDQVKTFETEVSEVKNHLVSLENEYQQNLLELEQAAEKKDSFNHQKHEVEISLSKLTQNIQNIQVANSKSVQSLNLKKQQLSQIDYQINEIESKKSDAHGSLQSLFSERSDLESELKSIESEIDALENEKTKILDRKQSVQKDLTKAKIQHDHLIALDNKLEGVGLSSKVMAQHLRSTGQNKVLLADFVDVPEILQHALEAVMHRNLQRVSVDNVSQVNSLQDVLKQSTEENVCTRRTQFWLQDIAKGFGSENESFSGLKNKHDSVSSGGMAAVVTQNSFPDKATLGSDVESRLFKIADVIGPLKKSIMEKVNSHENTHWMSCLTGFWLVKSKSVFWQVQQEFGSIPFNLVSLDGDILYKEGFLDLAPIEPGDQSNSVSLINRKRDIEELGKTVEATQKEFEEISQQYQDHLEKYQNSKIKFQELAAKLTVLNPDVEEKTRFIGQVEASLARLQEKKGLISDQLEKEDLELNSRQLEFNDFQGQIVSMQSNLSGIEVNFDEFSVTTKECKNKYEQIRQQKEAQQIKLDEQVERLSNLKSELAALSQEKSLADKQIIDLNNELSNSRNELEALLPNIENLSSSLNDEKVEIDTLRLSESNTEESYSLTKKNIEEFRLKVSQAETELYGQQTKFKDIESSLSISEVELKNIKDNLFDKYQLNIEEFNEQQISDYTSADDIEEFSDPAKIKDRIKILKNKIDKIGKVNMVAAEEFQSLSSRHEYLFVQKEDLEDSLSQLQDAVDKINKESVQRFKDSFDAVNFAFQKTFPVLFGGGVAELRLTDPENLLESGVEIIAQPPGKKLQSITLLSGGEKALTAVSLILGIFSIKPSPFAVLDEVDAPLDDANVARFNTQVQQMAKFSQIIMITHNKQSMLAADSLYGVTMEEAGVTKVASARLTEMN